MTAPRARRRPGRPPLYHSSSNSWASTPGTVGFVSRPHVDGPPGSVLKGGARPTSDLANTPWSLHCPIGFVPRRHVGRASRVAHAQTPRSGLSLQVVNTKSFEKI